MRPAITETRVPESLSSVPKSATMETHTSGKAVLSFGQCAWTKLARRKRMFLVSLVAALPVCGGLGLLASRTVGSRWPVAELLAGWPLLMFALSARVRRFPCPRCGRPFVYAAGSNRISRNRFWVLDCVHCGPKAGTSEAAVRDHKTSVPRDQAGFKERVDFGDHWQLRRERCGYSDVKRKSHLCRGRDHSHCSREALDR